MDIFALKELLYKIADDQLILGHRNSEWTGMGPLLEEDIAFSSMAQDKIGQSLALYNLLHQLGEQEPDTVAFTRKANQFHNCVFVELPNGEYDFSLIRHFLFDTAEAIRFELLANSTYEPLAQVVPSEQAIPSRSSATSNASPSTPGNEMFNVFGRRGASIPFTTAGAHFSHRSVSKRSRNC